MQMDINSVNLREKERVMERDRDRKQKERETERLREYVQTKEGKYMRIRKLC